MMPAVTDVVGDSRLQPFADRPLVNRAISRMSPCTSARWGLGGLMDAS